MKPLTIKWSGGMVKGLGWALLVSVMLMGCQSGTKEASDAGKAEAGKSGGGKRGGGQGIIPVRVAVAKRENVDRLMAALGTVVPIHTVAIRSRVDGTLQRVMFREGDTVRAGQVLAEIDARPFQLKLDQAQSVLERDRVQWENAKRDLQRYEVLAAQSSGSLQQRDTQAALVKQLDAAVKISRSQMEDARLQLSYTRLVSPIQGRIGLRGMDSGNLVKAGDATPLAIVVQTSPIQVVFPIPQDQIAQLLPSLQKTPAHYTVFATLTASVDKLSGLLFAVDNQVDTATGTVKLKAQFNNEAGLLFPNQFVNVQLRAESLQNVVTLPSGAIQQGATGSFVYVVKKADFKEGMASVTAEKSEKVHHKRGEGHSSVEGGRHEKEAGAAVEGWTGIVSQRTVTVSLSQGSRSVITKGLEVGEQVVIEGVDKCREGARVRVSGH